MTTFSLPSHPGRVFEAVTLRHDADGTHPLVTRTVARQVVAELRLRHAWIRDNLVVADAPVSGPGEVVEVIRPQGRGLYDLAPLGWVAPRRAEVTVPVSPGGRATSRPAQPRRRRSLVRG